MMMLRFLSPVVDISVPIQKEMATAWRDTARKSFQTPESDSSSPMAMPSKRLCMERARMTREERM